MYKPDSEIQQAVIQELTWDPRVDETEVGVQVSNGVVTLTGNVGSWGRRWAAQEAAHRVAGVLDVANDVRVTRDGAVRRTDSQIAQAVRHALEWDVFVPEQRIRSTVSDGHVTLEGDVDYNTQREDAAKAIRNLIGVRGVSNLISVRPPQDLNRSDVRQAIEDALHRRAHREAMHIDVDVVDGKVTLSGSVNSWHDKDAVLGAARSTSGVRTIEDHVSVVP
jgi:osmotically-inducible protein OsmY